MNTRSQEETAEAPREIGHVPVLLQEVVQILRPHSGGRYVDGTLGGGGHAEAVLGRSSPDGELLGLDWDQDARDRVAARLARYGDRVIIRSGAFSIIGQCLQELGWEAVDGILIDLGVSSFQLDLAERGFSFSHSGPLDMRMDRSRERTVDAWLREIDEVELTRVLRDYGEEPRARRIARAILAAERRGELKDTIALATVVGRVVGKSASRHPATRTFQALRIAVNGELEALEKFLRDAYLWLRPGGRLVVLAYHSLEDRMVKQAFRLWSSSCLCPRSMPVCRCGWSKKVTLLTARAVRPSEAEIAANPRARSARLRAVERVAA